MYKAIKNITATNLANPSTTQFIDQFNLLETFKKSTEQSNLISQKNLDDEVKVQKNVKNNWEMLQIQKNIFSQLAQTASKYEFTN